MSKIKDTIEWPAGVTVSDDFQGIVIVIPVPVYGEPLEQISYMAINKQPVNTFDLGGMVGVLNAAAIAIGQDIIQNGLTVKMMHSFNKGRAFGNAYFIESVDKSSYFRSREKRT